MFTDKRRARALNTAPVGTGAVVYWMQRDQRANDNWALLYAQEQAASRNVPLLVLFNLVPTFGQTTLRHYDFMLRGLKETEQSLRALGIPLYLKRGLPTQTLPEFVAHHTVGEVVTDFNPLRFTRGWREQVGVLLSVRLTEVDAHNIVACWAASDHEEFAAYTFRPKLAKLLPEFLTAFPPLQSPVVTTPLPNPVDWDCLLTQIETDRTVLPVDWLEPGASAAHKNLEDFCGLRLSTYYTNRNDPNKDVQSNLSPYLHFGQLSAQRVALHVSRTKTPKAASDAYLEELIVRRELADNYCFYNENYTSVKGAHRWAQKTIAEHTGDVRQYLYTRTVLDRGETHDDLWNAMQRQLVFTGKLPGWCRMYWAKKLLEWSTDAQTAIDTALYLNDRYELDGTDPSGIVGVMWSIAGVHDRAWGERPIFGKIRYMNYAGAKRKFDVKAYINRWSGVAPALFS